MDVDGVDLIGLERQRQIHDEGYSKKHDLEHGAEILARAGAAYALADGLPSVAPDLFPWPSVWKPKDRLANLVRAGALIAAAIDVCLEQEPPILESPPCQHLATRRDA